MKKIIIIFSLVVLSFFGSDRVVLANDVNSEGKFKINNEEFDLEKEYSGLIGEVQKNCSQCQEQKVKEVCFYLDEGAQSVNIINENDVVKILFIFDNNSAGVAWWGNDQHTWNYTGKLLNWKKNGFEDWNLGHAKEDDDASAVYEKTGKCPAYLTQSINFGDNYFYLSTGSEGQKLDRIEQLIEKEPGNDIHTYYSVSDHNFVEGSKYTCNYGDLTISFDESGNLSGYNLPIGTPIDNKGQADNDKDLHVALSYISPKFKSSYYKSQIKQGTCPKTIAACAKNHIGYWPTDWDINGNMNYRDIIIYGDEGMMDEGDCDPSERVDFHCQGDNCSDEDICGYFDDYKSDLVSNLEAHKACSNDNCRTDALDEYNKSKDLLANYCSSILKTQNYTEGLCVEKCLDYSETIASLENQYKIRTNEKIKCNIGSSVISMLYNVLKWAKYIVPALVIILSILDFIKAIASQSEDDMKKAQGKFVKRLTVAAILFLLPLIINFLLKTFGLYSSECDITNLFG